MVLLALASTFGAWSFVAGLSEFQNQVGVTCSCSNRNLRWPFQPPPFVGNNYFCETAITGLVHHTFDVLHSGDPLWDGEGCGSTSTCCEKNQPPWFCATLPGATDDNLELRICSDQPRSDEDVLVSFVEIYVALA